jgi:hypothetical protein
MFVLPSRYILEAFALLALLLLVAGVSARYLAHEEGRLIAELQSRIVHAHGDMETLAQLLRAGKVDADVSALLPDCAERGHYEQGLGALAESTHAELEMTKLQYAACGDHYALQKEIMVLKLEHAVQAFSTLRDLSFVYTHETKYDTVSATWDSMLALERERALLQREQVALQGAILNRLLDKKSPEGELARAGDVAQSLAVKLQQLQEQAAEEERLWQGIHL